MNTARFRFLVLGSALCFFACSPAEVDPRDRFLHAAQAAEATPRVRYRFQATVKSPDSEHRLEGTALLERLDLSGANFRARLEAVEFTEGGNNPRSLLAVRQTDDIYLLDSTERLAEHGSLYAGGSALLYRLDPALMYAFYDPQAVASEALAATVTSGGRTSVRGEPCDIFHVTYVDDEDDSRWCLGIDDDLPRLMEWIGPETTSTLEIFAIESLDELSERDFDVDIPDNWTTSERSIGPPAGSPAESWALPTTDGRTLRLEDLRGQVVVLDFWATWCPPCISTLDSLEDLQAVYRERPVRLIAVNTMESGHPEAFLEERSYTFDTLLEGDALHSQVAPGSLPAFAVIDASGNWAGAGVGYYGEGSTRYMIRLIDRALEAGGSNQGK